jgi:hypothetical protein
MTNKCFFMAEGRTFLSALFLLILNTPISSVEDWQKCAEMSGLTRMPFDVTPGGRTQRVSQSFALTKDFESAKEPYLHLKGMIVLHRNVRLKLDLEPNVQSSIG